MNQKNRDFIEMVDDQLIDILYEEFEEECYGDENSVERIFQ